MAYGSASSPNAAFTSRGASHGFRSRRGSPWSVGISMVFASVAATAVIPKVSSSRSAITLDGRPAPKGRVLRSFSTAGPIHGCKGGRVRITICGAMVAIISGCCASLAGKTTADGLAFCRATVNDLGHGISHTPPMNRVRNRTRMKGS